MGWLILFWHLHDCIISGMVSSPSHRGVPLNPGLMQVRQLRSPPGIEGGNRKSYICVDDFPSKVWLLFCQMNPNISKSLADLPSSRLQTAVQPPANFAALIPKTLPTPWGPWASSHTPDGWRPRWGARARAGLGSLFTPWEKPQAAAWDDTWGPHGRRMFGWKIYHCWAGGCRWSFRSLRAVVGWWTSRNGWISTGRVVIIHLRVPKEDPFWSSVAPVLVLT